MNYDQRFAQLIADIKADKSIVQPWRNKAIGRIDEAQALLEKGQRMTNMQPPAEWNPLNERVQQAVDTRNNGCTCLPGTVDRTCPIHGN